MAAPATLPGQSAYSVSRPAGKCAITGNPIAPGDAFMAVLNETPAGLERQDVLMDAWTQVDASKALAFWKSVMPHPEHVKKKPFVDDEVLLTLFERLSDTAELQKQHFRFVLGLILMRKRLLAYESSETRDGQEHWIVKPRGRQDRLSMLNPHLSEDEVKAVSTQLGDIMNEDL